MSRRRRWLVAAAGLPLAAVAVLALEVEVARRGDNLDEVDLVHPPGRVGEGEVGERIAVWLGDSTAYGIGVTDVADGVAGRIAAVRDEQVVMLAVSGATLSDVVDRQLPMVAASAPDIVYLSVGANDTTHLTRRPAFEAMYRRLLDGLPAGVPVVVLGLPDFGSPPRLAQPLRAIAGFRARQFDRVVRRVVNDRPGTTYVDIAGPTGPQFRRDPDRYFSADGYHPSAEGYALWAEAVLDTVGQR